MLSRRAVNLAILSTAGVGIAPAFATAPDLKTIDLPKPWTDGGKPLAQALWARRSTREFADRPLPIEVLSNLLWSAVGINRPATADRTVPSWRHAIESEVYVARADGAWSYDAKAHRLTQILADDIRAQTGVQDFVGTAPVDLVYVADGSRLRAPRPTRSASGPTPTPASSARTSTCSAHPRDWQRCFAARSTGPASRKHYSFRRRNSSPACRRSAIRKPDPPRNAVSRRKLRWRPSPSPRRRFAGGGKLGGLAVGEHARPTTKRTPSAASSEKLSPPPVVTSSVSSQCSQ